MQAIEPNWISLLWFAAFATIGTLAFLIVAGMFPLRSRPDAARSGAATLLVVGNAVLLAALLIGTGLYGYAELRWSTLIVVTGLVVLFAPGLFEAWPSSLRDGTDRTCRAGRRSTTGACDACESRGAVLGQPIVIVGRFCDACKDQTRPFAARRPGGGHRRLSISICSATTASSMSSPSSDCFMIFAMWLFPEVKRDAPATAKTRSSQ